MPEPFSDDDVYRQEDQKRLRLVTTCERCEAHARARAAMTVDLENSENQMKAYRRQIGKLKSDLLNERREGAFHVEAEMIYEYWKKHVKPNALAFGEDRQKAVLGRLNDKMKVEGQKKRVPAYTPRYICESVRGVKWRGKPYDLAWICRNSANLEYCHGLYDQWVAAGKPV